ncbi:MAG: dihydrofolate reductase [Chlamydiales bacterium]|nr:dihydrofolate reductase [Chlamydiales bacterium]
MIAVVACTASGGIAHLGKTPWHLPEDLKFFWDTTQDSVMIMGRKTYDAIPKHRLENKDLIVFSNSQKGSFFVSSLDECLEQLKNYPNKKVCVTGGQDIFELFFQHELIDTVLLTHVYTDYPCDRYFPLGYINGWTNTCFREDKEFSIHRLQR